MNEKEIICNLQIPCRYLPGFVRIRALLGRNLQNMDKKPLLLAPA